LLLKIIELQPSNQHVTHPTIATGVLSSVGLSPLMLALAGFIHEAHVSIVNAKDSTFYAQKTKRRLWLGQAHVHSITVLGMVLIIVSLNSRQASGGGQLPLSLVEGERKLHRANLD
jgi:hypothetical protein